MTPLIIGAIGIGVLLFLLFARMPIGFAMAFTGLIGFAYLKGLDPAFGILGSLTYRQFTSYTYSVAPLFILMGNLCFVSGISSDLFKTANAWLGHKSGGLAMATVGACGAFAAVSGSSMAAAATMATVAFPEMKKYNYSPGLAAATIATAGTLGAMIPPSLGFVFYGIITEQSISKLFIAGVIPGLMQIVIYLTVIYIICKRDPLAGPKGLQVSFGKKIKSLSGTWSVILLFVVILGGIYTGIFSANEAGGIGAFGAFLIALFRRRLTWENFHKSLMDTVRVGTMAIIIITGVSILNSFLAVSQLPSQMGTFISSLPVNRYVIIVLIMMLYLLLGMVMDPLSMVLLTVPIITPMIESMGFDLIWFGVLVTAMGEIGVVTPPLGINVFVVKGVAAEVPTYTIFRSLILFLVGDLFLMILLIAFPKISLFLPSLMN